MSEHIVSPKVYYTIFAMLMIFTALTVVVAYLDLGVLNLPVALLIAVVKATVVVLYFMHVKYSSRLTKLAVVTAVFTLLLMFGFTLADYFSRYWVAYVKP
jgi:cytochrome c oxidase subunit IV